MASSRLVKKRIRSTKNISQITKAMEAVSAVKMRKSEELALSARPYALAALRILGNLSDTISETGFSSPLLEKREAGKICLMVIASDKGLCGSFNSNILRKVNEFVSAKSKEGEEVNVVAIGKKSADFCKKRNIRSIKEITGAGDYGAIDETRFLAELLREIYESGEYKEIYAAYTNFLSVMKQEPQVKKILPFDRENIEEMIESGDSRQIQGIGRSEYIFEPAPEIVLQELLPKLLEIQVYHIILEANASEHSARMMAMKNASENAEELIETLTLEYNKARQAQITRELTEITAGAAALE
jgi:F-type H+-transporting ATPase subunit gamma